MAIKRFYLTIFLVEASLKSFLVDAEELVFLEITVLSSEEDESQVELRLLPRIKESIMRADRRALMCWKRLVA